MTWRNVLAACILLGAAVEGAFATAAWRFAILGDSRGTENGVNVAVVTELAARLAFERPDLVLFNGDMVLGSTKPAELLSQLLTWRAAMAPLYAAEIPVLVVRGNHELGPVHVWNEVFSGEYAMPGNGPLGEVNLTYTCVNRNALFIGLDNYVFAHRVNQPWLDAQLAANTKPHVFVIGHEPAFKANHEDCLDDYPAERDAFWESLRRSRVRMYACGHDHFYANARIDEGDGRLENDVHQVIVGTAGAPLYGFSGIYDGLNTHWTPEHLYYAPAHGYLLVEVAGLRVNAVWMERASPHFYVPRHTWSYTAVPRLILGDINCDGEVNFDDLPPFVQVLTEPSAWRDNHIGCPEYHADVNQDGQITFADIKRFVALLNNPVQVD